MLSPLQRIPNERYITKTVHLSTPTNRSNRLIIEAIMRGPKPPHYISDETKQYLFLCESSL